MAIIAPSASALQTLLNQCEDYASCHDIIYNVKKTVCMCVRPATYKSKINLETSITLSGNVLKYVSNYKYNICIYLQIEKTIWIYGTKRAIFIAGAMLL